MSVLLTPSERMRSQANPHSVNQIKEASFQRKGSLNIFLKVLLGTPVPIFLMFYMVSLTCSMSGMEIFSTAVSLFTLLYILVDRLSNPREFRFFQIGVEIPFLLYFIVIYIGLKTNAPQADMFFELGRQRWMILLYFFCYSLDLFPQLNRLFYVLMGAAVLAALYANAQHFTGIDLTRGEDRAISPAPFAGALVYQVRGFLSHHLTYGYSFAMIFCFPFAAAILSRPGQKTQRTLMLAISFVIGLSLFWTYGRGVWIASLAALLIMVLYVSRKLLFSSLLIILVGGSALYYSNDGFRERLSSIWAEKYKSNDERREVWRANMEMFTDYPWFGIGYGQNEERLGEYFQKMNIKTEFAGHAHNNYIQSLANTGILGFALYMIIILNFLLMTHRLYGDIPSTHYWHRVLALGALGGQVALHTGGLTQWNFGDAEVLHVYIFILAVVAYLTERYRPGNCPG